jgi:Acetyltransferases, including N-acetylases of ribosomal proteins
VNKKPSIVLRKLEPDDLPLLYAWENDSDAWLDGDTHNPLSEADLREYILRTTGDIYQDGQLRLMICPASESGEATNEAVGCVDLYDVDIRNRRAAVAIYVSHKHRNQGYAEAALLELKSYVAHILCFRILYALVREENSASKCLFQAAGFKQVAVLPEWINEGNILVLQSRL